MKNIIPILLASCLFLASCNNDDNTYYDDMYLAFEIVDNKGNDLLGSSSSLIHQGETKVSIGANICYLDSLENDKFTFRHIIDET
ncbi:MAG: hypothetical protein II198_02245, partial [Bacteroidaceae bacterium]|nr:hypothetical protein [Bacteroidaceae bacterium]